MTKNFKSIEPGIHYFVTFTVVEWLNVFTKPEYLKILWDSLQYCRKEKGMKLYGFVFMTNHLHLIISTDDKNVKLWEIIRDFKKIHRTENYSDDAKGRKQASNTGRYESGRNKKQCQHSIPILDTG